MTKFEFSRSFYYVQNWIGFSENNFYFWHFWNCKNGPNVCQLGISDFSISKIIKISLKPGSIFGKNSLILYTYPKLIVQTRSHSTIYLLSLYWIDVDLSLLPTFKRKLLQIFAFSPTQFANKLLITIQHFVCSFKILLTLVCRINFAAHLFI